MQQFSYPKQEGFHSSLFACLSVRSYLKVQTETQIKAELQTAEIQLEAAEVLKCCQCARLMNWKYLVEGSDLSLKACRSLYHAQVFKSKIDKWLNQPFCLLHLICFPLCCCRTWLKYLSKNREEKVHKTSSSTVYVCVCVPFPVLSKVSVIIIEPRSLVGGEFHQKVCVEGEGTVPGAIKCSQVRTDTVAVRVSAKACVSWHQVSYP